jgi:fatty-acyl-CoA synthase
MTQGASFTYVEMQSWSRRMARGLIECGIRVGDHVAVVMANFPEFVAVKYAISRIGAVAVPVNFALKRQELSYILEQSDSKALIIMDRLRDRDYLADLDALAPGWELTGGGTRWPQLRHVIVHFTEGESRSAISLGKLGESSRAGTASELAQREANGDPHFRSDVIYTSGTTGLPKGVMLSHDMILRAAYASAYTRAFEDGRGYCFPCRCITFSAWWNA